jgi:phosphoglucomutase
VIDLDLIRSAGVRIGVDPLGGASLAYWQAIAERHRLDIEIVNDQVDPTFRFVPLDWDGKTRMDCSSPYAMSGLIELRDRFDVAVANDPDADRHGIVTPSAGLMNPNHHLAVCIAYLFGLAREWGDEVGIGKTLVSSSIIDRVAADLGRRLVEVPVGFKWFVPGCSTARSASAARRARARRSCAATAGPWSTDKDGLIPCLLAAEMTAAGAEPGQRYRSLGRPVRRRGVQAASTSPPRPRTRRSSPSSRPEQVTADELAGEPITDILTKAPGNDAPIGGLKVVTESGWFAARPSGTEAVYKVYAESLRGEEHLERILAEAEGVVRDALGGAS